MALFTAFHDFIEKEHLLQKNERYLLAFSGGIDSVVLCDLLHQAGFLVTLAHVNFQLRGHESDADQAFAKTIAEAYKIPLLTVTYDTALLAKDAKEGIQQAARKLRYDWFRQLIAESHARKQPYAGLITAHHADDNIETVWLNLLRGTGLQGLKGMDIKEGGIYGHVIRPLLFATKAEICTYATKHELIWREDSSNQKTTYGRNKIRLDFLPFLSNLFPHSSLAMQQNIHRFKDEWLLHQFVVNQWLQKIIKVNGEESAMPVALLLKTPGYASLLFRWLSAYGFSAAQLPDIVALLEADSGRFVQSPSHKLIRNRKWLLLAPHHASQIFGALLEENQNACHTSSFHLEVEYGGQEMPISTNSFVATLDAKHIQYPLIIRRWKKGDYFYPLGLKKKKKLSDFFINKKLSITEKEKVWVVESNQRIVWIIGHRIDDRFKITDTSTKRIRLSFTE